MTSTNSSDKKTAVANSVVRPPYSEAKFMEGNAMYSTRRLGQVLVAVVVAAAFPVLVAGEALVATSSSKATHRGSAKSTVKPAARTSVTKTPITFSITSRMRSGNLVVSLDNVPVFNEKFEKPALLISQTTRWDPVELPAGKHKLTAKVYGTEKIYISAVYDLEISRTKGIELRFRMKGDKLTVEPAS